MSTFFDKKKLTELQFNLMIMTFLIPITNIFIFQSVPRKREEKKIKNKHIIIVKSYIIYHLSVDDRIQAIIISLLKNNILIVYFEIYNN